MPKTKEQKKEIIKDLKEKIDKQKAAVFVDIKGLKAQEIFDLRQLLKKSGSLLTVAKKTLMGLAFKERKIKVNDKKLVGQPAIVSGFDDEVSPAKIAFQFSKKNEKLKILGGILEKEFVEKEKIVELAQVPTKIELYAKVVGTLSNPISGFARVLSGNIRGLVYLLSKIKK